MTKRSAPSERVRVYTVGHSTRTFDAFVALLEREGVRRLVDVRTFPGSRRHPQFNREPLAASLAERGIAYEHAPALGGRRRPSPDSVNTAWRNEGFRGYADHMQSAEFGEAIARLERAAAAEPTAVMCAEAVPWRCHRSLLSDALVARGHEVLHILDDRTSQHTLTPFARIEGGELRYVADEDAAAQRDLFGDERAGGRTPSRATRAPGRR